MPLEGYTVMSVQEPDDDQQAEPESALIGWQYAAAIEAEQLHQSTPRGTSPLAGIGYDFMRREGDLFRFTISPVDQQVTAVVDAALAEGAASAASSRECLTQDDLYTVLTYAKRQAVVALRKQEAESVRSGFRALGLIDAERIDWRDAAVTVGLLAYTAGRVGLDPVEFAAGVAGYAEPRTGELLQGYCSAPKGLAEWGYREVRTSAGSPSPPATGSPTSPPST